MYFSFSPLECLSLLEQTDDSTWELLHSWLGDPKPAQSVFQHRMLYNSRRSDFQGSWAPNHKSHGYQRQLLSPGKLCCNVASESYFTGLLLTIWMCQASSQRAAGWEQLVGQRTGWEQEEANLFLEVACFRYPPKQSCSTVWCLLHVRWEHLIP